MSSHCRNVRYPLVGLGVVSCVAILLTYLSFGSRLELRSLPYRTNITSEPLSEADYTDESESHQPPAAETSGLQHIHTTIPHNAYIHGFTVLDNIYLRNGTFYVVTPDRPSFPSLDRLLSLPIELDSGVNAEPTDELQFIDPEEATQVLGPCITRIEGLSVIVYDPAQFMKHFYHWFGEIILGVWRVYSHVALGANITPSALPLPRRFMLPFIKNGAWRDRAGVDGPLMRAAFPDAAIEQAGYWKDLAKLGTTAVFERIVLVSRKSAHKHPFSSVWYKMIAGTMNVSAPDDFWTPIRASVWQNVLGAAPDQGVEKLSVPKRPLVTYISRQGSGRRLVEKDHEGLVAALRALEDAGICEFQLAAMERLTLRDQIELVSRSTILVGVHGNGLTHQLWMPPSPRSTTIEILVPNGYVFDYEILARNMGHRHYAVWNDTFLTYEKGTYHKGVNYPAGFHGIIPVHGPLVADIIRKRLLETEP
ncbi:hypothetical protein C8R44DRAFT_388680 [Mycena epipterygia]|nr:hypothetical protein C8R44DRAFT_388680 [Mycena epipterygia]